MPKFIDLDPEDRTNLGQDIVDGWNADNEDRDDWLTELPKWLDAYAPRLSVKNEPWEGASNLPVPVTGTVVDAIHARLIPGLMQPEPIVSMRPQEPSDAAKAKRREIFIDWACREDINIFPVMDRAWLATLINGVQVIKMTWEIDTRHLRTRHTFPQGTTPDQAFQLLLQEDADYMKRLRKIGDNTFKDILAEHDTEYEFEETDDGELVIYTERDEIVRESPEVTLIDPTDIAFNSDAEYDLQKADHIYHRIRMTLNQLKRKVKDGIYHATDEEIERIEKDVQASTVDHDSNTDLVRYQRDRQTGVETAEKSGDPDTITLIDAYCWYDVNDDGYEEQIVATVVKDMPDIVLRVHRLEDVFRHGMRPFELLDLYPIPGTIWSYGIPKLLEPIQSEFNTIHNQRNDAGTIANMPWGAYRPAAGGQPERMPLQPGYLIPLDNPKDDIWMHTPSNYTAWQREEEQLLWALTERRTRVNDLTLGRVSESQGASRTATGVQTLSAQQATGFDILIRRAQECFRRVLRQLLALYEFYLPPGKIKRIVGDWSQPDTLVTREDLVGHMDMYFTGNSLSTDREVQRNTMTFLAQQVMNPASIQFLMTIGVIQPPGVAEWYRNLLKVYDQPGIEKIITMPELPMVLTPEEIVNRVVAGEQLAPTMNENHQQVIQILANILGGNDAQLPAEIVANIQNQLQVRQQALVQQQQMQMMMMQMAQMQMVAQGGPPGQPGPPQQPGPQPATTPQPAANGPR